MVTMSDLKRFVKVYQAADSVDAVAKEMNWKKEKVSSQSQLLRRKGIPLKKFSRNRLTDSDVAELAALCSNGEK